MNDILRSYAKFCYATEYYGLKDDANSKIIVITLDEFLVLVTNSANLTKNDTVILDEVDNLTLNKPFVITRVSNSNVYLAQYKPFMTKAAGSVIGFTGSSGMES